MRTVTFTEAKNKLSTLWDEVVSTREEVVIKRRGHPDMAILPAEELERMVETLRLAKGGLPTGR